MLDQYPSLLVTKLFVPPLRSTHVRRAELLDALDTGFERRLILVAAGAGFGKTTLMADWSGRHPERVAWLSLDEGDNSPNRFLAYLVAAIQTRLPQVGRDLLAALQSQQPPPDETAAHVLINQLAAAPDRLIVVLDDYELIDNPAVHRLVAFLLEHLPPRISLAVLTRSDPPLPMGRLRASHDLLEIRAGSLRFSAQEVADFLAGMGIALSPEAVMALEARTEGWIAGLQLAALAMQSLPGDREVFVRSFSGDHQFILDYLIEEVLARQPEEVRRFLLDSSILHRLNSALAGAVVEGVDGQAMIDYLEKHNLFLVPLDQQRVWYRYHHLFADLLQTRLRLEAPDRVTGLYRRAAGWLAANGLPEEAVEYAMSARDFDQAAQLILGPAIGMVRRGEVGQLMRWHRGFPQEVLDRYPRLTLQFALACALGGRWEEAQTMLDSVSETGERLPPADEALLAYMMPQYRPDEARLMALVNDKSLGRGARTSVAMLFSVRGDLETACEMLSSVQDDSELAGDIALMLTALFHRCRLRVYQGLMHHAYVLSQQALHRVAELGRAQSMAAFGHSTLGRVYIEWNELERAHQHLHEAMRLAQQTGFVTGMMSGCAMMLSEVEQARGDFEAAASWAGAALDYSARFDPPHESQWIQTYQVRMWLAQGNLALARKWLDQVSGRSLPESLFFPFSIRPVTRARVLLAQRKPDQAVEVLMPVLDRPRDLLTVEALGVLALARQAQADAVHAQIALEQALELGEQEDRVRAFMELGAPIAKLVDRFCRDHPGHEFANRVLAALPAVDGEERLAEPLSDRELEVLRLISAGRSNEEIAGELTIALSTVKWYVNTLYAKLHVKTRAQAIARVHEMRLLEE